ncbi:MAG: sugar phosphate nucleotidyltransferase [Candidatus Bathyarchaeota archaeon]|nr:sugar phosphate nucleotidyltransferase [Candidatus Bathyarchaeota archaeon]
MIYADFSGKGVIAFREIENPIRFGVVELIGNRINRFVEKPRREEAPSNLVNAGIYVLA